MNNYLFIGLTGVFLLILIFLFYYYRQHYINSKNLHSNNLFKIINYIPSANETIYLSELKLFREEKYKIILYY